MKVERAKEKFEPIHIILETPGEVLLMDELLSNVGTSSFVSVSVLNLSDVIRKGLEKV